MVLGIALPALLLALDVDHLAGHRLGLLVLQIVEFAQVARREAELPPDVLERVVLLGQHVVHAVGDVDVVTLVGVDRHAVVVRIDGRLGAGDLLDARLRREPLLGVALQTEARGVEPLAVGTVQQVELALLDDADQPLGVVRSRGVAGGLQSAGPALVVVRGVGEERVVAGLRVEEFGVVLVRGLDRGVGAEAFALGVVVVVDALALPARLALDAEVVVRLHCQEAVAAVRLEDSLGQGDAGRDAVTLHVCHGDVHVSVDILLAGLAHLGPQAEGESQEDSRQEYCFSGNIHYLCLMITDKGIIFR